jgi:hypothetical protein
MRQCGDCREQQHSVDLALPEGLSALGLKREAEILYGHFHGRSLLTRRGLMLLHRRYSARASFAGTLCVSAEFGRENLTIFCPQCGDIYMVTVPSMVHFSG